MATSIFKNRYNAEGKIISDKAFYAILAGTLFFGFVVNALEVLFLYDFFITWNPLAFYITYIVMVLAGVIINVVSRNPVVSFIGYCMVVLPIGALLSICLPEYSITTVISAFMATTFLTLAMMLIAIIRPQIFYSMFKVLMVALMVALLYEIIAFFSGFGGSTFIDWLVVLLFCCYVGFDVSLARSRPKTLDNAVDSACGLYLDIINIFVRLLSIISRNSR
jgi:FtsH-binding integral membrane protein